MRKIFYTLVAILSVALASCTFEEKEYFETGSAQRANETIKKYNKILTSSENGWLIQLYPEANRTYGGFNVFAKFLEDGRVAVECPSVTGDVVDTSFFKIEQSAGIVLSFDTYNDVFHAFSDPADPLGVGGKGYGLEGDYDYLFVSVTPEKIVLMGKKNGNYSTMYPISTDWESLSNSLAAAEETICDYSSFLYCVDTFKFETTLSNYKFVVNTVEKGVTNIVDIPFAITVDGCEFYEPVEIAGSKVSGFKITDGSNDFVAVEDENIKLSPVIPPLNKLFVTGAWYIAYNNASPAAQALFDVADAALKSGEGEDLNILGFTTGQEWVSSYTANWGLFFISGGKYAGKYQYTYELTGEDKVTLKYNGTGEGNGSYYLSYDKFNKYMEVFGYNTPKTFTITADNIKKPTYMLLTEDANPDNYVKLVPSDVDYK